VATLQAQADSVSSQLEAAAKRIQDISQEDETLRIEIAAIYEA
jgi:hypothetical protein